MAPIRGEKDRRTQDVREKLDKFRNAPSGDKRQSPTHADNVAASTSDDSTHSDPDTNSDTARVLAAIAESRTYLTNRIDEVKVDISLIRQDMQKIRERVTETEARISVVEDTIAPVPQDVRDLQRKYTQLLAKMDDQENRQRRSNLRFVGLPEGAEGRAPETFLENCLIDTFGREKFSSTFVIERAHRIPMTPGPPGSPPRTFIAKLLNFRDRDAVLRLTRELGHLTIQNAAISVYPDFSITIQKERAKFIAAKRKLRDLNIKYSMLYPSKLRVVHSNATHFFQSPEDVFTWIEQHGLDRPPRPAA